MARWSEFEAAEPEFAARVRSLLTSRKHLTMATLRRDGSPRISGTELEFADDCCEPEIPIAELVIPLDGCSVDTYQLTVQVVFNIIRKCLMFTICCKFTTIYLFAMFNLLR